MKELCDIKRKPSAIECGPEFTPSMAKVKVSHNIIKKETPLCAVDYVDSIKAESGSLSIIDNGGNKYICHEIYFDKGEVFSKDTYCKITEF